MSKHGVWETALLESKTRAVCAKCNNQWMSKIENSTKPLLVPMIMGRQAEVVLSPGEQEQIAIWAFKTSLMLIAASSDATVPLSEFHQFHESRLPSRNAIVWAAAYQGRLAARSHLEGLFMKVRGVPPDSPNGYVATINVYRMVLQVFGYFGRDVIPVSSEDGPSMLRIWPIHDSSVVWPRNGLAFDDSNIDNIVLRSNMF